jgi:hypothetical protein
MVLYTRKVRGVRRKSLIYIFSILMLGALASPPAKSATTIPIVFRSMDVDQWTFPQNSEIPRAEFPTVVAVFPPCTNTVKTDCIAKVEYQDLRGKWIEGKFSQPLPYKFISVNKGEYWQTESEESNNPISFKEDVARNIPALSRSGYWTFPGLKQSGGDKFLVDFTAIAEMSNKSDPLAPDSSAIWNRIQFVRIAPITPLVLKTSEIKSKNPKGVPAFSGCGGYGKNDKAFCWKRNEFVDDSTFRMSVRLNKTVGILNSSLWFTARTKSSSISVNKDASGTVLTFTGKPIQIGNAVANLPRTKETYDLVNNISNIGVRDYEPNYDASKYYSFNQFLEDYEFGIGTETLASVRQWEALESVAPIKISAENGVWRFTPSEVDALHILKSNWNDKCTTTSGVLGMASSNAAVFVPTIPTWNASTSSLDFQIASTHLNKSGKLNTGFYGISVSESIAKCLWGVNSNSVSAQVSITGKDENKTINLTSSSASGGFYNFNVSGFHFSSPKISLKIKGS